MNNLLFWGNIIGYIGVVLIYIQVVFGSRHIFKIVTRDTVLINKIHKQIGIYGIFFVLAHPLFEMMNRSESLSWLVVPNFSIESELYVTLGKFAFIMFFIIWITSAIVREKIKWRPWKYIHLLSYIILFFIFIHLSQIGTFFEDYAWLRVVFYILSAIFFLSIIMRLLAWAGVTKIKYRLVEKNIIGDIMLIKLAPVNVAESLKSNIGQHFFLQSGSFKSEHPFSIIRNQNENVSGENVDGVISFGIRKVGNFWEEMMTKNIGDIINVDGPYGVFTREAQNVDPKVIIAAGVGVTPFVDLIEKYGEGTVMINCNRKMEEVLERDMLKSKTLKYIDELNEYAGPLDVHDPNNNIKVGMIDENVIIETVTSAGYDYKNINYFICGSPGFMSFLRSILQKIGVPKNRIYYEDFGF